MNTSAFTVIGLSLNLLGSVILIFTGLVKTRNIEGGRIESMDIQTGVYVQRKHIIKQRLAIVGFVLLALGFLLQILGFKITIVV